MRQSAKNRLKVLTAFDLSCYHLPKHLFLYVFTIYERNYKNIC